MKHKKSPPGPTNAAKSASKKAAEEGFRPFTALKALRDDLAAAEAARTQPGKPMPQKAAPVPSKPVDAEDEAMALARLMSGVTPLSGKATRIPRSQDKLDPANLVQKRAQSALPVQLENDEVHAHLAALVEGGRFEVQDDGKRVEGRRHGIKTDVVRMLRRGQMPIDGRLDLHGQSAAGAQKSLETFLAKQRQRGERCVLVVHGKGEHSPGQVGVLRGEMAAWLSQGGASVHVDAFATAHDEDGGEGAVYVLLRR